MAEASFGGSVPEVYDRGMVPLVFADYARDLVSRVSVPDGGRVLELACGTGVVTRALRETLPSSVEIVATDVNPDMMAIAERSLSGVAGVRFQIEDATALSFGDASFDCVICQFGIMFFPDKDQGYAQALRVLKPGGSFVFNVWDSLEHNPLFRCADETIKALLPEDPPPFMQIPFGYYDVAEIEASAKKAGFDRFESFVLPGTSRAPSAEDVATTFTQGTPLAPIVAELGLEQGMAAFTDALQKSFGDGAIESPMQAIAFELRKA